MQKVENIHETKHDGKPLLCTGAVEKAQISIYNEDCLQALKAMADKQFDLAIVDPPYGIDAGNMQMGNNVKKKWTKKDWDKNTPNKEYFDELKRISKNQIIWGGNYFELPPSKCWVIWDKNNGDSDFADGEMAWTSFNKPMRIRKQHWCGSASNWEDTKGKIHPTQKPVALYKWILENYAEKGSKILDTHLGSGSIAIACWDMGYDLTAYEVDKEYYDNACKRLETHKAQLTLW